MKKEEISFYSYQLKYATIPSHSGAVGLAVGVNVRSLASGPAVVTETASGNVSPDVVAPIAPRPKNVGENNQQHI